MNGEAFGIKKHSVRIPISLEVLMSESDQRPGRVVVTPKSPEWLAERKVFKAMYEELVALGLEQGYLEKEPCYECSGEVGPTTNMEDREWVYDDE